MSDLEKDFKKVVDEAYKEIHKHLAAAHDELDKACEIAEKHGIPFHSSISPLSQSYKPASFSWDKWEGVDTDELFDSYGVPEYEGWQHSAVCW